MKSTQALAERNDAITAARDVVADLNETGREATASERATMRNAIREFDRFNAIYETSLDSEKRDKRLDAAANGEMPNGAPIPMPDSAEGGLTRRDQNDWLRKFLRGAIPGAGIELNRQAAHLAAQERGGQDSNDWLRRSTNNAMELRELTTATASSGAGNTIDDRLATELYIAMEQISGFRSTNPRVIMTDSGEDIKFPRRASRTAAARVAESAAIGGTDPTFDTITVGAHKYGALIDVTYEVLSDSGIDLTSFLAQDMAEALTVITETDFITGNGGTDRAQGIAHTAGVATGVTGATGNVGVPTFKELNNLKYSIDEGNMMGACWLMKRATVGKVANLTDSQGQFFWAPSRVAGEPDMLLGYPVKTSPQVADTALSAKSVFFGNFREAVILREVGMIRFERSADYKFNEDLVTFRALTRLDTGIINANAVKAFVGGAS